MVVRDRSEASGVIVVPFVRNYVMQCSFLKIRVCGLELSLGHGADLAVHQPRSMQAAGSGVKKVTGCCHTKVFFQPLDSSSFFALLDSSCLFR